MERSPLEQIIDLYRGAKGTTLLSEDIANAIECALHEERMQQATGLIAYHDEAWSEGYAMGHKRALDDATDGTLKALQACEGATPPRSPVTRADVIRTRVQTLGTPPPADATKVLHEINERVNELLHAAKSIEERLTRAVTPPPAGMLVF